MPTAAKGLEITNYIAKPVAATLIVAASDSLHPERADYQCDGVDDQVEIQAAIGVLPPQGGKIHLLSGTYYISSTILMDHGWTTLEGENRRGGGTVLYLVSNSNCDIIECTSIKPTLINLELKGNKANQTAGNGVYAHGGLAQDLNLWNVYSWEIKEDAVYSTGSHDQYIGCIFEYSEGYGIHLEDNRQCRITNCDFYHNSIGGLLIDGGAKSTSGVGNHVITGCIFYFGSFGIYLDDIEFVVVVGNVFTECNNSIKMTDASFCNIEDCNFNNILGEGIWIVTSDSNKLSSLILYSIKVNGIKVMGSSYNTFENLQIIDAGTLTNNTYYGIYLAQSDATQSTYNYIRNCIVRSTAANKPKYGIGEDHTSDYNHIEYNALSDFVTGALAIVGANTVYSEPVPPNLFMDVLAVSATHVRSNEDLSEAIPNTFTIDAQPDVPRTLSGHFDAHANITAYTIDIVGVDAKGNTVTEQKTQADGWDWETSNAFATITSIIMSARTGTGAGDTMDIGITDVLGLSNVIYETSDVYKIKKDNANAVVAAAQVDVDYDTYDMAVIGLAAGSDFTIWFRSNLNIIS